MLTACLQVGATGYTQTVSLMVKDAPLETVFQEIRKQTGYNFIFTTEVISAANPVNINVQNASLRDVLDICFQNQPLSFTIEDKFIVIKRKIIKPAIESPVDPAIDITGKVLNNNGEPIGGATVAVKNTKQATATNERGEFFLPVVDENATLVVSSIGHKTVEVKVQGRSVLEINLEVSVSALDETVVIAYGTTTRRLNTGSVAKISAAEIGRQPIANPLSAIQGRAAGVFVNTENGMPGGNITVQIRGKGSINAGTDPLYIIDGVPFNATPLNETFSTLSNGINGKVSPLNSINPADIESIEILKDADATAIYGSRAANGVILITTKNGSSGKTKISFNLQKGISRLSHFPELLNLPEYLEIRREGFQNSGIIPTITNAPDLLVWDTTKTTDWPKYILGGTAHTTDIQTSISGGNEYINFLISGNFRKDGTILPGDQHYERAGFNFRVQHNSNDKKLSINLSSTYTSDNNNQLSSSIFSILTLSPNIPLYDNAGNFNWVGFSDINPAAVLKRKANSNSDNLISNITFKYWINPNLQIRTSLGYNKIQMEQVMTYPKVSLNPGFGLLSYAYFGNNKNKTFIIEPQIEYSKKRNLSNFQILLGSSWQKSHREGNFISGQNYSNDELLEYIGAAGNITATNLDNQYKYASVFSRFHFDYNEKYILNVSLRRDGSSRFGPGNQFGNFGAIGAAWIFTDETFLKNFPLISFGKLRSSYGITGNDLITDYQYLSSYRTASNYQGVSTLTPSRIANADFMWENNKKFETAIEIGLFKNAVLFTTAWYLNKSGNQLIDYPLPYTSGPFGSYKANLPAEIQNKGWEFEVNASIIRRQEISWSVYGNISFPNNKLLKYPGLHTSSFANTYVIGEDLGIKRAFNFTGINSQTGLPEYEDINKDGFISAPLDWTIIGKTSPYYFGGYGSDFNFKQFEVSLFFQFSKQYAQGSSTIPGTRSNKFDAALKRWQKPGDITTIAKAVVALSSEYFHLAQSDAAFYNASYMRLKNISLSYILPQTINKKLKIENCKLYIQGQNLFTWHNDSNLFDPETANTGIPPLKSIAAGIQLNF